MESRTYKRQLKQVVQQASKPGRQMPITQRGSHLPISLEMRATTGAAPVPVPPPMPAVMKTRSAPCEGSSTAHVKLPSY